MALKIYGLKIASNLCESCVCMLVRFADLELPGLVWLRGGATTHVAIFLCKGCTCVDLARLLERIYCFSPETGSLKSHYPCSSFNPPRVALK
jgi:hypothetical protein